MAQTLYWIAHPTSTWPGTPSGAQVAAGQLSSGSAAAYSGSETGFTTSGTQVVTEATSTTGASASTEYTHAAVVYDGSTYSNVHTWTVTTGNTGSLAKTNANDTLAASGTTTVAGSVARTNANDTSTAAGTTTVTGSLANTNANDTLAASGDVGGSISGSLARTNANDTAAASGTTTVVGSLSRTNADDTVSASGTTTVVGTLGRANANDTVSASGAAGTVTGTVAYTNADDISSASGSVGALQTGGAPYDIVRGDKKKKKTVIEKDTRDERQREFNELLAKVKGQANERAAVAAKTAAPSTFTPEEIAQIKTPRMPSITGVESVLLRQWMPDLLSAYRQQFQQEYARSVMREQSAADEEEVILLMSML